MVLLRYYKTIQYMKYQSFLQGDEKIATANASEYGAVLRRAMSDTAYSIPESALRLPFDKALLEKSRLFAAKLTGPTLNYVVVVGIGGSSLGAKAVYEALFGTLDGLSPFAPKILFAETCSPEYLSDLSEILVNEVKVPEEIVLVVISKSGTTTETMVNASVLVSTLERKLGSLKERIVCITNEGSPLWQTAETEGFATLPIPKMVDGRFSVFSPVGMFPLLVAGIDAEKLLTGAQDIVDECVSSGEHSRAYRAAQDIFRAQKNGAVIFDFFLFHPELESVGKWCRQLFGESLGKATTKSGTPTTHRIVPTVSIGTTDLHSAEQMFLAYPDLALRMLVRVNTVHWEHKLLAPECVFAPLVEGLSGRAPCQVVDAIYAGVKEAYQKRNVAFTELELPDVSLETLGMLLQFEMCVVMYLADMLEINAFDQPNVEEYKEATRRILNSRG